LTLREPATVEARQRIERESLIGDAIGGGEVWRPGGIAHCR